METIVSKSYGGAQTRLILPKTKDIAGVTGDNLSTRLCFKLPKSYATGWVKYIEFDCEVEREDLGMIRPSYLLDADDSFLVPFEIASIGGEIQYNLKFVSEDGTVTERSELGTLYFRSSSMGTDVEPEPSIDILTYLVTHAHCSVEYEEKVPEGGTEALPTLIFSTMVPNGETDEVTLNVPYLDANGHILTKFIDKEIVVEIFHVSSPNALTSLTQAQIPDMALIDQSASTETFYMDLYMLVGADPTVAANWYLVHTDNPTFNSVSASSADFSNTTTVGLSVTGNETVSGNVSVAGQVSTAQVNTPKVAGTGTSPNNLELVGNTTVKSGGLTVQEGTLSTKSITDNGESVSITKDINASGRNINASTVSANLTGNVTGNVTGNLSGNATTATTADNYNTAQGGIKDALDGKAPVNHASDEVTYGVGSTSQYGHVKVDNAMSDTSTNPVQNKVVRDFVNSSIGTATANFLGTYDAHDDLGLTVVDATNPTNQQIATALANYLTSHSVTPTSNDYVFVSLNFPATVDVDEYRRFKYNGSAWLYEYTLNNSSFTQAQWDSINSLVTNTSDPKVGVDVKDINNHLGNSIIHVPTSSDTTNSKVLANTRDGAPTWQTVSASNPTLAWGQESTIGTIAGQTFKVTMPANPDTDTKVSQTLLAENVQHPLLFSHAGTGNNTPDILNIVYRNNSIYANPSTGSIYATKVYAGGKELAIDENVVHKTGNIDEVITGQKNFQKPIVLSKTDIDITTVNTSYNQYLDLLMHDKNDVRIGGSEITLYTTGQTALHFAWNPYRYDRTQGQMGWKYLGMKTYSTNEVVSYGPWRASPTEDTEILTLGNGVTLGTNQIITGLKTFNVTGTLDAMRIQNSRIVFQNPSLTINTIPSDTVSQYISFSDSQSNIRNMGTLGYGVDSSGNGFIDISARRYTNEGTKHIYLWSMADGTGFVTAPNRAYADAGSSDILVKAHVTDMLNAATNVVHTTGDETIAGTKTFTPYINGHARQTITVRVPTSAEWDANQRWFQIFSRSSVGVASKMILRGYSRHDSFECVIGFGGSGSTAGVNQGYFIHRTNASRRILVARDDTNNLMKIFINSVNTATGWALTIDQISDSYGDTSTSNIFPLTYNDTAMVGPSLTEYAYLVEIIDATVNTFSSQSIAGIKTFTSGPVVQSTNYPRIFLKDTNATAGDNAIGELGSVCGIDKDENRWAEFRMVKSASDKMSAIVRAYNVTDTSKSASLIVSIDPNNNMWVESPYRTYSASNTSDIVTIGMLNTAMTLAGAKTFTSTPVINMSLPQLYLKHTTDDYTQTASATDTRYFIGFQDKNGQDTFHISEYLTATQRAMSIAQYNKASGSVVSAGIGLIVPNSGSPYCSSTYRSYASAGNSDILVKGHVPDLISANVGNGQISLTSSRGTAIDSFTVNQSSGKNIVLPAGSTQYQNVSVTFTAQSPADFSDYPYMASYSITGLTADMYATVTFSEAQVSSGQYAPFCQTVAGAVRLYAKSDMGAQTIPTISVGMDDSSAQQSMSNFVTLSGAQTIAGVKTFTSSPVFKNPNVASASSVPSSNIQTRIIFNANDDGRLMTFDSWQYTGGTATVNITNEVTRNSLTPKPGISFGVTSAGAGYIQTLNQRAYNSSNTTDIVTIGSLQASTDVVHRTGDEEINGLKSFNYAPRGLRYVSTTSGQKELFKIPVSSDLSSVTCYLTGRLMDRSNGTFVSFLLTFRTASYTPTLTVSAPTPGFYATLNSDNSVSLWCGSQRVLAFADTLTRVNYTSEFAISTYVTVGTRNLTSKPVVGTDFTYVVDSTGMGLVDTSTNQSISGEKTLTTWLTIRAGHDRANVKIHNSRFNTFNSSQSEALLQMFNDNDEPVVGFTLEQSSSNYRVLYLIMRKSDGTLKKIPLGDSS